MGAERLNDQEVARLVKRAALAAVGGDFSEKARSKLFGGHSLRDGLASSAEDPRRTSDASSAGSSNAIVQYAE